MIAYYAMTQQSASLQSATQCALFRRFFFFPGHTSTSFRPPHDAAVIASYLVTQAPGVSYSPWGAEDEKRTYTGGQLMRTASKKYTPTQGTILKRPYQGQYIQGRSNVISNHNITGPGISGTRRAHTYTTRGRGHHGAVWTLAFHKTYGMGQRPKGASTVPHMRRTNRLLRRTIINTRQL